MVSIHKNTSFEASPLDRGTKFGHWPLLMVLELGLNHTVARILGFKIVALDRDPMWFLGLLEKAGLVPGSEIYMDNLFSAFPTLEKLSEKGIRGTGTVRQNQLHKVPIKSKKNIEKKNVPCGDMDVLYRSAQDMVGWKDNKAVYIGSNQWSGLMEDLQCIGQDS